MFYKDRIEKLESDIRLLEKSKEMQAESIRDLRKRLSEVERNAWYALGKPDLNISSPVLRDLALEKVAMEDVVSALVEHLGLSIRIQPKTPSKVVLTKKGGPEPSEA